MTKADEQYIQLLKDIMDNGVEKDTRAGKVKSVFGRQLRFDLKEGFPLLTTKKVFTKGVLHELLWFLQRPYNSHGSMNIEYLVRNGVHIWDDDAYRWFKTEIVPRYMIKLGEGKMDILIPKDILVCLSDDEIGEKPIYEHWIEADARMKDPDWLSKITKEEFLDLTLQKVEIRGLFFSKYRFGDLGPVYGKQWRSFGESSVDQINNIINTLKTNPNDRRMLCIAFNPDQLDDMALPPCHVMMQFYTRPLTWDERWELYNKKYQAEPKFDGDGEPNEHHYNYYLTTQEENVDRNAMIKVLDEENIPKYGLSCMWVQRSVDTFLGATYNISSYSALTYMIAKLVNMIPDELVGSLGDCHIYEAHFDAVREQLSRTGSDIVPKLIINGNQKVIEDFKYEDFKIVNYHPDPVIKAPLLVG